MPKVLSILNRSSIGGPVAIASIQAKYLEPDFDTLLVFGQPNQEEKNVTSEIEQNGIKVCYIPEMRRELNPFNDYLAYRKLKKIIREFKPDIVHTHSAKPGTLGRLAAHSLKVPVILHTFHGHVFHSYFSSFKTWVFIQIERFLAKHTTRIIAISPLQKKELSEVYEIASPEKIEMIPIGLFLEPFVTGREEKRARFRREFNLPDDTVVITICGRIVPIKNHGLFVKALSFLKKNTNIPIKALVVGDGECRALTQKQCLENGLSISTPEDPDYSCDVIFTSWRRDIDVVNAGSDIITLTSLNEGTPLTLIEAQASGKPVVATKIGGIADAVWEGGDALLSPLSDENAFFNNLLSLVNNKALREEMGKKGPSFILNKYGHERLARDFRNLYNQLLQQSVTYKPVKKLSGVSA